jgi:hypothetical protein
MMRKGIGHSIYLNRILPFSMRSGVINPNDKFPVSQLSVISLRSDDLRAGAQRIRNTPFDACYNPVYRGQFELQFYEATDLSGRRPPLFRPSP